MGYQNQYNPNTNPRNGSNTLDLTELLKRSEEMLGTLQYAHNNAYNMNIYDSLGVLEQRATQLRTEIETKLTAADVPASYDAAAYAPDAISEGGIDTLLRELSAGAVTSQKSQQAPAMSLQEIEKQFLQDSDFQSQALWDIPAQARENVAQQHTIPAAKDIKSSSRLPDFPDRIVFDIPGDLKSNVQNDKKKKGSIFKKLRIVAYSFLGILIFFSMFVAFNQANDKPISGYRFYNVISHSMDGMIDNGSLVFTKETPGDELISGDVITFKKDQVGGEPITHQIIEIVYEANGAKSFITKGYNNQTADPAKVLPEMVLGKVVFHMPLAGCLFAFINRYMFLILIVLLVGAAAVLLFFIPNKAKRVKKRNGKELQVDKYAAYIQQLDNKTFAAASEFSAAKPEAATESKQRRPVSMPACEPEAFKSDLQSAIARRNHDRDDLWNEIEKLGRV